MVFYLFCWHFGAGKAMLLGGLNPSKFEIRLNAVSLI